MSYVPVRKLPFTTSPTADMVRYGLGAFVVAPEAIAKMRTFAQELTVLIAQGKGALKVEPLYPGDQPEPSAVYWPQDKYENYVNAWDQVTTFTYGSRKVFALGAKPANISAALLRVQVVIADYDRKAKPSGLPQWAKLTLGILGVGIVGAFFLGRRGKPTVAIAVRKKPRKRRTQRRVLRRRRVWR